MTETIELPPRSRWGWSFIAALVVEIIVFAVIIGRSQGILQTRIDNLRSSPIAALEVVRINEMKSDLNKTYVAAGLVIAGTLAAAVMGFRRRKS